MWKIDPAWEELAKRVEVAEYHDRELDSEIAVMLFGGEIEWKTTNFTMVPYPVRKYVSNMHVSGFGYCAVENFIGNIHDAYMTIPTTNGDVWHMVFQNRGYINGVYQEGKAVCIVHSPLSSGGGPYFIGVSANMAAAITAAGLRAHGYLKVARELGPSIHNDDIGLPNWANPVPAQAPVRPEPTEDQQG